MCVGLRRRERAETISWSPVGGESRLCPLGPVESCVAESGTDGATTLVVYRVQCGDGLCLFVYGGALDGCALVWRGGELASCRGMVTSF